MDRDEAHRLAHDLVVPEKHGCESEQQHVLILVRACLKLDQENMWQSWYEIRACLKLDQDNMW